MRSLRMVLGFVLFSFWGRKFLITKFVSTEEINLTSSIEKFNDKIYTLVPKVVPSQFSCSLYALKTFMLSLQIHFLQTFSLKPSLAFNSGDRSLNIKISKY